MNFLDCNVRQEERHDEAVEKIEKESSEKETEALEP